MIRVSKRFGSLVLALAASTLLGARLPAAMAYLPDDGPVSANWDVAAGGAGSTDLSDAALLETILAAETAPTPTPSSTPVPAASTPLVRPSPVPPPPSLSVTNAPLRLKIPRIGVDATVQPVGQEADGSMGSPSGPWSVGWWDRGYRPGEPGSAVIDGHVDYHNVGPAVFWRLRDLQPGDRIEVTMPGSRILTFVIERTEVYAADDDSVLGTIFAPSDVPRLNLITCTGVFDPAHRNYDRRLVVFSKLQS